MNRLRTTKRLAITMLGLTVGVLTPLGPAYAQEPATDLARPDAADLAADAARVVDDAPPVPPETLDFDLLADEVTAVLERMPAEEWVLADVAASLGGDPVAAFEFVRDHIGFDPYLGSLRSPQATLASRAGNGWDRAQLLQALLAEAPFESRFASGTLDDPTTITTRALAGATEPLPRPESTEVMPFALEPLLNRARRDHAAVVAALGEDYETLGADSATDVGSAEHAWLQIREDGGEWLDLDPTLPDAAPGETLAGAAETYDELPADIQQLLTFRLVADSVTDAGPTSEIVLDTTIPASSAGDADVWLLFGPENTSAGATLAGALGENPSFVPVLYLHGDARSGSPFSVGADTGEGGGTVLDDALGGLGGLGGGDATEGDSVPLGLTELRLEITTTGPGLEPQTVERILFDGPTETALPAALDDAHHLLISNGGLDLRRLAVARGAVTMMAADILNEPEGATEYRLIDQLLPWAVADRTLAAVSEHVITPSLGAPGEVRGYVGRPRAWIVSHGLNVDDESFRGAIDLALDGISLVGAAGTDAGDLARERLWYGVLQTALETEAARKRVRRSETEATLSSVSIDTAGGLERLDPSPSDTETVALATALADGAIVLGAGYGTSGSFWRVNPTTGATTSVREPGVRPSSYGGSYPGGGGGYYQIDPDMSSRRLNAPRRGPSGGGLEYQVVQVVSFAAAITGAFAVGWFIGRAIVNVLDWLYSD